MIQGECEEDDSGDVRLTERGSRTTDRRRSWAEILEEEGRSVKLLVHRTIT